MSDTGKSASSARYPAAKASEVEVISDEDAHEDDAALIAPAAVQWTDTLSPGRKPWMYLVGGPPPIDRARLDAIVRSELTSRRLCAPAGSAEGHLLDAGSGKCSRPRWALVWFKGNRVYMRTGRPDTRGCQKMR